MQRRNNVTSRRTPPPDVVRSSSNVPLRAEHSSSLPAPNFLIVGLFALRLAKRLIEGLDIYSGRDADIAWLSDFVTPYPFEFALAKISGAKKEDYVSTYQGIISRMKRQPRYPIRFMQMIPDPSTRQRHGDGEAEREMTDLERLDIIDFCDAASEWGSAVPIPAREADRMIELADQRRIADLDERRMMRDDRNEYEVYRR